MTLSFSFPAWCKADLVHLDPEQKKRKVQLSPYQEQLAACFELILTEMENLDNVSSSS